MIPNMLLDNTDVITYTQTHNIQVQVNASAISPTSVETYISTLSLNIENEIISPTGKSLALFSNVNNVTDAGTIGSDISTILDTANNTIIFLAQSYNGDEPTWSDISHTSGPSARWKSLQCQKDQYIYILGGIDTTGTMLSDFWRYDIVQNIWEELAPYNTLMSTDNDDIKSISGYIHTAEGNKGRRRYKYDEVNNLWIFLWSGYTSTNKSKSGKVCIAYNENYMFDSHNYYFLFNGNQQASRYTPHTSMTNMSHSISSNNKYYVYNNTTIFYIYYSGRIRNNEVGITAPVTLQDKALECDDKYIYVYDGSIVHMYDIANAIWTQTDADTVPSHQIGEISIYKGSIYSFGGSPDNTNASATDIFKRGIVVQNNSSALNWNLNIVDTVIPKVYDGPAIT